jgi:hypothetical protein
VKVVLAATPSPRFPYAKLEGLIARLGGAGLVNVTLTLALTALEAASVAVTCQVSVKFSPNPRVALMVGLADVVEETVVRDPDKRLQP